MLKIVAAGVTALFVTASPFAYAQAPSAGALERLSEADLSTLTDARIDIVKAALQLTPDQEKFWPPIEAAIRARARDRQARIAAATARASELRAHSPIDVLRDRNPVEFLQRRADALAQRAADLKKLADAWQPLYPTLTPEQKRRMAALTIFALREMRNAVEHRRLQSEDDDEE
jgi:LTXXQ motif family protein